MTDNDNRPRMTISEVIPFLTECIEKNLHVSLYGVTGIGKTAILYSITEKLKRNLKVIQLASTESSDASGLPDMVKTEKNGKMDYSVVFHKSDMINFQAGDVVLLDEFNRSSMPVQQAWLGIFNPSPHVGVHAVNKNICVIAAMNDSDLQDGVYVQETDQAMNTRCLQVVLVPEMTEYISHFQEKYGKQLFIDFLKSPHRKEVIADDLKNVYESQSKIICTPRNLEKAIQWCIGKDLSDLQSSYNLAGLQAAIGKEAMIAFKAFMSQYTRLDGKELLKEKPCKLFFDLSKEVSAENANCLTSGIESAINLLPDSTESQIEHFFNNCFKLETNYSELIAVMIQSIKKVSVNSQTIKKVMAKPNVLPKIVTYNKKVKASMS
jgi:hypothetical protein